MADVEFVQFHPTVLWLGEGSSGQQPLISEAVRGEGAFLVDRDGVRFMQGRHPLADLAPRDVVSRASSTGCADRRRPRLPRCPPPRRGVPRGTVPLHRGALSRARLRPGHRAASGRPGAALRQRRRAHRPRRPLVARRASTRVARCPAPASTAPTGSRPTPSSRASSSPTGSPTTSAPASGPASCPRRRRSSLEGPVELVRGKRRLDIQRAMTAGLWHSALGRRRWPRPRPPWVHCRRQRSGPTARSRGVPSRGRPPTCSTSDARSRMPLGCVRRPRRARA